MSVLLAPEVHRVSPLPLIYNNKTSLALQQLIQAIGAEVLKCRFQSSFTVGELPPLSYTILRLQDPDLAGELTQFGAPVDERHPILEGTSLHLAAFMIEYSRCSLKIFKHLLPHTQNINAQDRSGCTPLHLAALLLPSDKASKVVKLLIEKGANPNIKMGTGVTAREIIMHRTRGCSISSHDWKNFLSEYRRECFRAEAIQEEEEEIF